MLVESEARLPVMLELAFLLNEKDLPLVDGVYYGPPQSKLRDIVDNTMRVEGIVTYNKTRSGTDKFACRRRVQATDASYSPTRTVL